MSHHFIISLLAFGLCSCAMPAQTTPLSPPRTDARPSVSLSTAAPTASAWQTNTAPPTAQATSSATAVLASPTPTFPARSNFFTDTRLGLAFEYPRDWRVQVTADTLGLQAASGARIEFARGGTTPEGSEAPDLPNTRCVSKQNPYGARLRVCADTVSLGYVATVILVVNGAEQIWTVSGRALKPPEREIMDQILQTLRAP